MVHLLLMVAMQSDRARSGDRHSTGDAQDAIPAADDKRKVGFKLKMWPRVLMQLVELLPHATRLIPIAERYFASKNSNEQASMAALAARAEDVQADLGQ